MKNFNFACRFVNADDGTVLIKCRDLPELLSWSVDGQPVEVWARYAVEDCLAFMIKQGLEIPYASPAQKGEHVVELDPSETAKILLSNEMVKNKIGRARLAEKANLTLPEVTRLLNLKHKTKIESISRALNSLGKRLNLSLEAI